MQLLWGVKAALPTKTLQTIRTVKSKSGNLFTQGKNYLSPCSELNTASQKQSWEKQTSTWLTCFSLLSPRCFPLVPFPQPAGAVVAPALVAISVSAAGCKAIPLLPRRSPTQLSAFQLTCLQSANKLKAEMSRRGTALAALGYCSEFLRGSAHAKGSAR